MTRLRKTIARETSATIFSTGRARQVIVALVPPDLIEVRLKGTQLRYQFPADSLFMRGAMLDVAARRGRRPALGRGRGDRRGRAMERR